MKYRIKFMFTMLVGVWGAALCLTGCAGGSDTGSPAGNDWVSSPFWLQPSAETQTPAPQESLSPAPQTPATSVPQATISGDAAAYVGTWVHTYEYFDATYHTTLVIDGNGTAAYYNEEAELGSFSATWQLSDGYLTMNRSDGVSSVLTLNGNTLVETTYEDGVAYQAEYYRN